MYGTAAILAVILFLYSVIADKLERTIIGGAITFTAIGLFLGTSGFGILDLSFNTKGLSILAELTLALLLFADAANADLKELKRSANLPKRLLLIGLPLTIVFGIASGAALFSAITLLEIALLATILAPTDAALGKAVVTDESVPGPIRSGLNFESGLNDGICVPIFLAFLAFATNAAGEQSFGQIAFHLIVEEVGIGAVTGIVIAGIGAAVIKLRQSREDISPTWKQLLVPALALACFATAQALGGSGFIASFVGGLLFGGIAPQKTEGYVLAAESTGDALSLLTWVVFGATIVPRVFDSITWEIAVYAVLSLTVVRMLPVWICLKGTKMRLGEVLFVGWFGPRGLASIVFTVMAIDAGVPGADFIALVVACTILFSIIGHGLSAKPFARLLARSHSTVTPAESAEKEEVRQP
ncbi:MAG: cation:proton antiporter [Roseobacter sp.]|jgi:NhaP-type Na+/H+ or K+/H+ antiporter